MILQVDSEASANLLRMLAMMQESGEFCDFTIRVSGDEIKAHRCVLAASCDYFKTSFRFTGSTETTSDLDLTHVGCDIITVKKVIRSFYTNEIDLDPSCLESMLRLVDYFMCDALRQCIESYMGRSLTFQTALPYFQLALQYRLNTTGMFNSAKWLLNYRFHDYFIHHPDALESSPDMVDAYITYDMFNYCNPHQLIDFMINNAWNIIERMCNTDAETNSRLLPAIGKRVDDYFSKLSLLLEQVESECLDRWKPYLADYLSAWLNDHNTDNVHFQDLLCHVRMLEFELSGREAGPDTLCSKQTQCRVCHYKLTNLLQRKTEERAEREAEPAPGCTNPKCKYRNNPAMNDPNVELLMALASEFNDDDEDEDEDMESDDYCSCTPRPVRDYLTALREPDPEMEMLYALAGKSKREEKDSPEAQAVREEPQTLCVTTTARSPDLAWPDAEVGHSSKTITASTSKDNNSVPNLQRPDKQTPDVSKNSDCTISGLLNGKAAASSTPDGIDLPMEGIPQETSATSQSDALCTMSNVLAVLAPSPEMACQLLLTDTDDARPLVKSPQFELSFYDIEMRIWRHACKLDFPLSGAMLDRHAWRMAFFNNCLFLLSLGKQIGLQFDILEKKWTTLNSACLFKSHNEAPVKSVIPIAVGNKLIVLSMSREQKQDETYLTWQKYYEWDPTHKVFILRATVQDDRMGLPLTQWTVDGNTLITVKVSSMMYRHISHVQYIHIYDTETHNLETHEVTCAMESGIKILARDKSIYLLDKEGWCRSYNLESSAWTGLKRFPYLSLTSCAGNSDSNYPALTHVTSQAGKSRWEITTSSRSINSRTEELIMDSNGELRTEIHPPAPFQFFTAMCAGRMAREQLDAMSQSRFYPHENQVLDFSLFSRMGGMAFF